ncbi:hypothetical protein J6590_039969 [Homalodisca vitripennis]|nr:hypothetical protein J6590_039969 [Homalodisca vitripennis]
MIDVARTTVPGDNPAPITNDAKVIIVDKVGRSGHPSDGNETLTETNKLGWHGSWARRGSSARDTVKISGDPNIKSS